MINTRVVLAQKFRLIFIPFLLMAVVYLIVYTFLNWLLFIKLELFQVREDYRDYWAPFILPWFGVLFWLTRRLKLLNLSRGARNGLMGVQALTAFAIATPMIIAQLYLETASGSLTRLSRVEDITSKLPSKYYTISSYYIDTANRGIVYISEVSGKYNQDLNLSIYISCPVYDLEQQPTRIGAVESSDELLPKEKNKNILYLLDNYKIDSAKMADFPRDSIAALKVLQGDSAKKIFGEDAAGGVVMIRTKRGVRNHYGQFLTDEISPPKAWCCFYYSKTISNRKSDEKKEQEFHLFYERTTAEFANTNMRGFTYFERAGYTDKLSRYKKAIRKTDLVNDSSIRNILEPKMSNYEDRNGGKFEWIFLSLGISSTVWFIILLFYRFDEDSLKNFKAGKRDKPSINIEKTIYPFKPRPGYFVTPLMIDLNFFVFLIMVFAGLGFISFSGEDLLAWGANFRPRDMEGQWWRLLTNTFLHDGIFHLVSNMAALFFVGILLEPKLGTSRMVICYLISGVCASLASIWWNNPIVSVGASGSIFGLYGVFLSLMLTRVYPKEVSKIFLLMMLVFIGYNLFIGINGGIDNAAHIGGLLTGILLGLIMTPGLRSKVSDD